MTSPASKQRLEIANIDSQALISTIFESLINSTSLEFGWVWVVLTTGYSAVFSRPLLSVDSITVHSRLETHTNIGLDMPLRTVSHQVLGVWPLQSHWVILSNRPTDLQHLLPNPNQTTTENHFLPENMTVRKPSLLIEPKNKNHSWQTFKVPTS